MASFSSLVLTILETYAFKVQKTEHSFFLEKFPLMKFQKAGTKLVFKYILILQYLLNQLIKIVH